MADLEVTTKKQLGYDNIQKVSYQIYWLDYSTTIKLNAEFSTNSKKYGVMHAHREVIYYSDKQQKDLLNINLAPATYLTLECKQPNITCRLNEMGIYYLSKAMESWYVELNKNFDDWYVAEKDGTVHLRQNPKRSQIECIFGQQLIVAPNIVRKPNQNPTGGLEITMNEEDKFHSINLELHEALNLALVLKNVNLYTYGMQAMLYAGRPDFGTNSFNINEDHSSRNKGGGGNFFKSGGK